MDEMRPLGVRTYAARQRPCIAPDNGGHDSKLWVFGALEPATGLVTTHTDVQHTRHEFIAFRWFGSGLSVHTTLDVQVWTVAHTPVCFLFQPNYSPWWRTLRHLAPKRRAFTQPQQKVVAIEQGTA